MSVNACFRQPAMRLNAKRTSVTRLTCGFGVRCPVCKFMKPRGQQCEFGHERCFRMRPLRHPQCRRMGDPPCILLSAILAGPAFCVGHRHTQPREIWGHTLRHCSCDGRQRRLLYLDFLSGHPSRSCLTRTPEPLFPYVTVAKSPLHSLTNCECRVLRGLSHVDPEA
jgi:hypothetical protein